LNCYVSDIVLYYVLAFSLVIVCGCMDCNVLCYWCCTILLLSGSRGYLVTKSYLSYFWARRWFLVKIKIKIKI